MVTPSALDQPPEAVGRLVGRALGKTSRHPSAPPPTTVHGPMIQPMSVAKRMTSSSCPRRLVGDLAGDRDEEAALHVQDALRLPRRARRVGEEVGVLGVDLERWQGAFAELDSVPASPSSRETT